MSNDLTNRPTNGGPTLEQVLRWIPTPGFQRHLRTQLTAQLERKINMTTATIPEGFRTLTPYLLVKDVDRMLEFYTKVFGAETMSRDETPRGGLHSMFRIGDSALMMGGPAEGSTTQLHYYLDETKDSLEDVVQRAVDAGATSVFDILTADYGERFGVVRDPAGNHWILAERGTSKIVLPEMGTLTSYLHPDNAAEFIEFMENAFGAEELMRADVPGRGIAHAKMRVGTSVLEFGEGNPLGLTTPTMFYVYVADVGKAYQQGLDAGAESVQAPAETPYGDYTAAFKDRWGNQWYVAEHRAPEKA